MRTRKAITPVIAIILLLMMTVAIVGMAYVFIMKVQRDTQDTIGTSARTRTDQLGTCISVDYAYGNSAVIKNCGNGVIAASSIVALIDGASYKFAMSPAEISHGETATVNLSGVWALAPGTHALKFKTAITSAGTDIVVESRKDGLVGEWNFNEGRETIAKDGSGGGNNGTLKNGSAGYTCFTGGACPQWVDGKYGAALTFDGIGDYVDAGSGSALDLGTGDFTVEAWVKTATTTQRNFVEKRFSSPLPNPGFAVLISGTTGALMASIQDSTAKVTSPNNGADVSDNAWHLVTVTFDRDGLMYRYVDGVNTGTNVDISAIGNINNNKGLDIGRYYGGGGSTYFYGAVDEVRIWNKALTPDETVNLKMA